MEIFRCDSCERSYPLKLQHPQEDELCLLCVAYIDLDEAEDYKEKFVAQQEVETITQQYTSLEMLNGLHAEDLGLDI